MNKNGKRTERKTSHTYTHTHRKCNKTKKPASGHMEHIRFRFGEIVLTWIRSQQTASYSFFFLIAYFTTWNMLNEGRFIWNVFNLNRKQWYVGIVVVLFFFGYNNLPYITIEYYLNPFLYHNEIQVRLKSERLSQWSNQNTATNRFNHKNAHVNRKCMYVCLLSSPVWSTPLKWQFN